MGKGQIAEEHAPISLLEDGLFINKLPPNFSLIVFSISQNWKSIIFVTLIKSHLISFCLHHHGEVYVCSGSKEFGTEKLHKQTNLFFSVFALLSPLSNPPPDHQGVSP